MLDSRTLGVLAIALVLACKPRVAAVSTALAEDGAAAPLFSFVTVGDSRQDPKTSGVPAPDKRWLQNTAAIARIVKEAVAHRAQALFFNGDMIHGYQADAHVLGAQYAYWRGATSPLREGGVYLVPVPGNHETQIETKLPDGTLSKLASPELEAIWRDNVGDLVFDTAIWQDLTGKPAAFDPENRPVPGGEDAVGTDQKQLTYSFDSHGLHFVVLNTDAPGWDSHAPVAWLTKDLAAAKSRGVKKILVFGHKQVVGEEFPGAKKDGLNANPAAADAFWSLIEKYEATYFCGHQHLYFSTQPHRERGGKAWQILVGSGGSPFSVPATASKGAAHDQRSYAKVDVSADGALDVTVYSIGADSREPQAVIDRIAVPAPR